MDHAACRIVNTAEKIQNAYGTAQNAYQKVEMARQLAALGVAAGQQGISGGDIARIVFEEAFELKGLDLVRMRNFDLQEVLDTLDTPCFTAGTLIATEHGLRPIETLKAGDQVWAIGQGTAETALKPITQTISRAVTNLVILTVGTERIETTAEHPFWVRDEGWVRAGELRTGDQLRMRDGQWLPITSTESRAGTATVFNFEVEGFHTYLVGAQGVVVHNVHGNDHRTTRPAQGYSLRDRITGRILKYGETIRGMKRYSEKFRRALNADIFFEACGSKKQMHKWQHDKILDHKLNNGGMRPPLNKSDY